MRIHHYPTQNHPFGVRMKLPCRPIKGTCQQSIASPTSWHRPLSGLRQNLAKESGFWKADWATNGKLVVWIPRIPGNERDCYSEVSRFESPNHQAKPLAELGISWAKSTGIPWVWPFPVPGCNRGKWRPKNVSRHAGGNPGILGVGATHPIDM